MRFRLRLNSNVIGNVASGSAGVASLEAAPEPGVRPTAPIMNLTNLRISISGSRRRVRARYVPTPLPEDEMDSEKLHKAVVNTRSKDVANMMPSKTRSKGPSPEQKASKKEKQKEEAKRRADELKQALEVAGVPAKTMSSVEEAYAEKCWKTCPLMCVQGS